MFGNNTPASDAGKMQRTTVPPSFDVYRSLPVSATALSRGNSSLEVSVPKTAAKATSHLNANAPKIPYPPVPAASLGGNDCIWIDEIDLRDYETKLSSACTKCELVRNEKTCEFVCAVQAPDGNEECNFVLRVWAIPEDDEGAKGKFFVEVNRISGCACLFRQALHKAFGKPCTRKCQYSSFRAPELPKSLCDDGSGMKQECVENLLSLATSPVYEQRLQGLCALADLCASSNSRFRSFFVSADGPSKIGSLQSDSDPCVKKVVSRIMTLCT